MIESQEDLAMLSILPSATAFSCRRHCQILVVRLGSSHKKKKSPSSLPPPADKWGNHQYQKWPPVGTRLSSAKDAKKFLSRLEPEEREFLRSAFLQERGEQHQKADGEEPQGSSAPSGDQAEGGVELPTATHLGHLAFFQALPFVGFGFLDNLIMILAGEYIDHTIGVTLGISTMAAAALGNAVSDVFGVGSAWYVEHLTSRVFGARPPPLTLEQLDLPISRLTANAGRATGVAVGCVLGMAPLLF